MPPHKEILLVPLQPKPQILRLHPSLVLPPLRPSHIAATSDNEVAFQHPFFTLRMEDQRMDQ